MGCIGKIRRRSQTVLFHLPEDAVLRNGRALQFFGSFHLQMQRYVPITNGKLKIVIGTQEPRLGDRRFFYTIRDSRIAGS